MHITCSLILSYCVRYRPVSRAWHFHPFPNKPWFLRVCSTSLLKTLWEKEKLLVTSNFSFSQSVFCHFRKLSTIFINFKIVIWKLIQFGRVQNLSFGKVLKANNSYIRLHVRIFLRKIVCMWFCFRIYFLNFLSDLFSNLTSKKNFVTLRKKSKGPSSDLGPYSPCILQNTLCLFLRILWIWLPHNF